LTGVTALTSPGFRTKATAGRIKVSVEDVRLMKTKYQRKKFSNEKILSKVLSKSALTLCL
jgi:hypothetical protein